MRRVLCLILCVLLLASALPLYSCNDNDDDGKTPGKPERVAPGPDSVGLEYVNKNNGYYVAGIGTCTDTFIVIPKTYNGVPVYGIDDGAFNVNYTPKEEDPDKKDDEIVKLSTASLSGDSGSDEVPAEHKITGVFIPDSVYKIGNEAFFECVSLSKFDAPDLISMIGTDAFKETAFYLDENNWVDGALYLDGYLIEVKRDKQGKLNVREGTTIIARNALSGCAGITEVVLPNSITVISEYAFSECASLERINLNIPGIYIGNSAFVDCTALTSVVIGTDDAPTPYDFNFSLNGVPMERNGPLYTFWFRGSIYDVYEDFICAAYVGSEAFAGCRSLNSVSFGAGVKFVGNRAFADCVSLNYVDMSPITVINDYKTCVVTPHTMFYDKTNFNSVFDGCLLLTHVVLPQNIAEIDGEMFAGCDSLAEVTYKGTVAQWGSVEVDHEQYHFTVHCTDGDVTVGN